MEIPAYETLMRAFLEAIDLGARNVSEALQAFVGSLTGEDANKGGVTTSDISKKAVKSIPCAP